MRVDEGVGEHAARRLLAGAGGGVDVGGSGEPYDPVPWFWSDQFGLKVQAVGRLASDDDIALVDGSLDERRFVALYGAGGEVRGALGIGRPAALARWRARLEQPVPWSEAQAEAADAGAADPAAGSGGRGVA